MFFQPKKIAAVRDMIMAADANGLNEALSVLLELQVSRAFCLALFA